MIEGVILAIVIVIAFGIIALPFIWNFLVDKNSFSNIDLSKAALYISFVVIVSIILATAFKINSAIDINKGADFIVKAIVPLATIAGFYMVYQTFIVQSENSQRNEVHELIKLQNRILDEIVLTEVQSVKIDQKDSKHKGLGEYKKETINHTGRSAFKKIVNDFNASYEPFQLIMNVFILKSILEFSKAEQSINETANQIIDSFSEKTNINSISTIAFIKSNLHYFKDNSIKNSFLKTLSYEELIASTLYARSYFDINTGNNYLNNNFNFVVGKSKKFDKIFYELNQSLSSINESLSSINKFFKSNDKSNFSFLTSGFSRSLEFYLPLYSMNLFDKNIEIFNQLRSEDLINKSKENSQDLHLYLDTYFRNLFNAYKTVKKFKSKKIRDDSARLLRTQISSYEQAVIFLNSLTPMGAEWQKVGDLDLFKELNTIKNIPENVLTHIQPWDVYPIEKGFKYKYKTAT